MNLYKMRELYESGEWVLVAKMCSCNWHTTSSFDLNEDCYKIIHKKHEHILDAYLDGCEIYVEDTRSVIECNNFIDTYYSEHYYEAVPKSLEDCHCEASELHYNKLGFHNSLCENNNTIFIGNCGVHSKKIQFNEQLNQWTYCPYEETKMLTTAQLEDILEEEQLNNFKDYGFEADFGGEILKEIDGWLFGYIKNFETTGSDNEIYLENVACQWYKKNGGVIHNSVTNKKYNLTPIKKEWYECEDMVGKIVSYDCFNYTKLGIFKSYNAGDELEWVNIVTLSGVTIKQKIAKCRPATKEEVLSIYYKDK